MLFLSSGSPPSANSTLPPSAYAKEVFLLFEGLSSNSSKSKLGAIILLYKDKNSLNTVGLTALTKAPSISFSDKFLGIWLKIACLKFSTTAAVGEAFSNQNWWPVAALTAFSILQSTKPESIAPSCHHLPLNLSGVLFS